MDGIQEILFRLDAVEVIVIKMASTASVLMFCFYMTRSHLRRTLKAREKKQKKDRGKKPIEGVTNKEG